MLSVRDILLGVLLPLVVSGAVVAVLSAWRRGVGGALGVGMGFVAGYWGVFGRPAVPPGNDFEWVVPGAVLAAVVGTVAEGVGFRWRWGWGVVVALVAWLLVRVQVVGGELVGLVVAGWVWWGLWDGVVRKDEGRRMKDEKGENIEHSTSNIEHRTGSEEGIARRGGRAWAGVVMVGVAGFGALVLMLSDSQRFGQMGLALVGAVAAVWVVGWAMKRDVWRGAGLVWGVVLYGLLVNGKYWAGLTWVNAGLLAVAPLLAWVGELPGVRALSGWKRGAVRVGAVVVPVVVAVVLAILEFQRAQASDGSEYYY